MSGSLKLVVLNGRPRIVAQQAIYPYSAEADLPSIEAAASQEGWDRISVERAMRQVVCYRFLKA